MVTVRAVGKTHTCTGADQGLFRTAIIVSSSSRVPKAHPGLLHPLVAHRKVGAEWKADVRQFVAFVTFGRAGIATIDAFAAIFLAWAHTQTSGADRSPWPGRSKAAVLEWAARQPWLEPGKGLGANGALFIARAKQNKTVNATELLATATPSIRRFLLNALGIPATELVAALPGSSPAHFIAPELWSLHGKQIPYTQPDPLAASIRVPAIPNRRSPVSAIIRCCREAIPALLSNGAFHIRRPFAYTRGGSLVSVNGSPPDAPFTYAHTSVGTYIFWNRATLVVKAIVSGKVVVTLLPTMFPAQKCKGAISAAESITWPALYHVIFEQGIANPRLAGHTPSAIANSAGTWLDLMAMPQTHVDRSALHADNGTTLTKFTRAAIAEDIILTQNKDQIPPALLARISSPAPRRGPTMAAIRAFIE